MNISVCVKQIPDPAVPGSLDGDHTLTRAGKLILDDSDAFGVEMSLPLAEKAGGDEVVLISMAPNGEVSGLRTAPDARLRDRHATPTRHWPVATAIARLPMTPGPAPPP